MKLLLKNAFFIFLGSVLLLSGCCLFRPSEPDVIVWHSVFIPDEWEKDVLSRLDCGIDCRRIEVAEARQMNDYGNGQVCPGNEMFAVVAACSRKSGKFVARWGYSPNPKSGENGLEVTFTNLAVTAVGSSSAKHPVGFNFAPDYSSLTMLWGPKLESRGPLLHRVTWKEIKVRTDDTTR